MKNFILAAMSFIVITGIPCLAQPEQPSLGDLAKANHSAKKPVKTFTNDNVASASPRTGGEQAASAAAPAAPASTSSGAAAKPADKKDSGSNSSTSKEPPAVAELRKKLNSYTEQRDGWKRSAKKYEDLLATETSDFRRQMYQDAMEGDKHNTALFQEKIDQTQADLAKAQKGSVSGQAGSN